MLSWGYKADGTACLFDLGDGESLPPGWSCDYLIIEDEALRTAEAITAAAGSSVLSPVVPSKSGLEVSPEEQTREQQGYAFQAAIPFNPASLKRRGMPKGGWPKKPTLIVEN